MNLVKGVIYEITDEAMDFYIAHNRVEYHSSKLRESDGKHLNICLIRQSDNSIETTIFYDEEIKCVSQVQTI